MGNMMEKEDHMMEKEDPMMVKMVKCHPHQKMDKENHLQKVEILPQKVENQAEVKVEVKVEVQVVVLQNHLQKYQRN